MITTAKMAAWLQAECLVNRWNSWEDDAFRSSSQHASPGSDTFPALWPTFCLSQQLSEHWTTCIYKRKLVWTLWWHKQTAHHIPWIPQIHTRERWVASGPVTHFTQEFDGLCNTTGVSQILHPVCYLSERRCDDTTFVLINTSVTITNRHETCCRLQERILNTPLLSVIWLKQHTSPDFINTLLFHSSEHIRLIWLFYYRSHWF